MSNRKTDTVNIVSINKIVLKDRGLKGAKLAYNYTKGEGYSFAGEITNTFRKPVHSEMMSTVHNLKKHFAKYLRLNNKVEEVDIEIDEIEFADGGIRMAGSVATLKNSARRMSMDTGLVDETSYMDIEDLMEALNAVKIEALRYLESRDKANVTQMAMSLITADEAGNRTPKISSEEFALMSDEEREKASIEFLEGRGVIMLSIPSEEIVSNIEEATVLEFTDKSGNPFA